MTSIEYLLLFLSPVLGGILAFSIGKKYTNLMKIGLVFGGGFLFVTCILHLIPENLHHEHSPMKLFIVLGFFFQIILEKFSEGIEHGHLHLDAPHGHDHHHDHSHYHGKTWTLSIGMLVSLSIHSLMEGVPLGGHFEFNDHGHNPLLAGVLMHKLPSAFALITVLHQTGMKKSMLWLLLLFFASMNPLGAVIGAWLQDGQTGSSLHHVFDILTALATGSFLHISTTILYENNDHHKLSPVHLAAAAGGGLIAIL